MGNDPGRCRARNHQVERALGVTTFDAGKDAPSDALVRHPNIDVANAPDARTEDAMYALWRYISAFDGKHHPYRERAKRAYDWFADPATDPHDE